MDQLSSHHGKGILEFMEEIVTRALFLPEKNSSELQTLDVSIIRSKMRFVISGKTTCLQASRYLSDRIRIGYFIFHKLNLSDKWQSQVEYLSNHISKL